MSNIEQYRKRFFHLMESTIGDAKPLISENTIDDEKINEYKGKWSVSNVLKNESSKKMYKDAIDKKIIINSTEDKSVVDYYNNMVGEGRLNDLITYYDKSFPSQPLGNAPTSSVTDLTGDELTKFYNVMIGKYQNDKSFEGLTIHSMLLNNRDKKIPVKDVQNYINKSTGENFNLLDDYNKITDKSKFELIGKNTTSKK